MPVSGRAQPRPVVRSRAVKTQSYRFRGGVARVAAWHGRPDVASLALQGPDAILDRRRRAAPRPTARRRILARSSPTRSRPGASLPLVDFGFAVRGRLHLLVARPRIAPAAEPPHPARRRAPTATSSSGSTPPRSTSSGGSTPSGLDQAARATPRSHIRVSRGKRRSPATGCSAAPTTRATCNGSPSAPTPRAAVSAPHCSPTGCAGSVRTARVARSSTRRSTTNAPSPSTSEPAFGACRSGLCVLGRSL